MHRPTNPFGWLTNQDVNPRQRMVCPRCEVRWNRSGGRKCWTGCRARGVPLYEATMSEALR